MQVETKRMPKSAVFWGLELVPSDKLIEYLRETLRRARQARLSALNIEPEAVLLELERRLKEK